jgi:hypothetical protein
MGEVGHGDDLTAEMREQLERIVIRLLDLASRCGDRPALQHALMETADQISALLEESKPGSPQPTN